MGLCVGRGFFGPRFGAIVGFGLGLRRYATRDVFCLPLPVFFTGAFGAVFIAGFVSVFMADLVLSAGFALAEDLVAVFIAGFDEVEAMAVPVIRKAAAVMAAISLFKMCSSFP